MDKPNPPHRSIEEIATERNQDPVETFIDLALEKNLKQFFLQPLANENQDHVLEMMKHPAFRHHLLRLRRARVPRLWTHPYRPIC